MVIVDASQMTMRLIGSPSEAFAVDPGAGNTRCEGEPLDAVGPGARPADEDVSLGKVGNPAPQTGQLRQTACRRPQNRGRRTPWAWQLNNLQTLLGGEDLEITGKQGLRGVALQQYRLTWRVLEPLGQRAQGRDADAGTGEHNLPLRAGPAAQPPVRTLKQHPGAPAQVRQPGAAVTEGLRRDSERVLIGSHRQRERVGTCPSWPAEEPDVDELPGPHWQPVQLPPGEVDGHDIGGLPYHADHPEPMACAAPQRQQDPPHQHGGSGDSPKRPPVDGGG